MSVMFRRPAGSQTAPEASPASSKTVAGGWQAAWSASVQRPGAGFAPNWSERGFADQTIRQVIRPVIGGEAVRLRLSNIFGSSRLDVTGVDIALGAAGAAIRVGTLRHATVNGRQRFTIAAGAECVSDPIPFMVALFDPVTITMYLAESSGPTTYHAQALVDSYRAAGDRRTDVGGAGFTETSQSWYYLGGLDVPSGTVRHAGVVVFGDSLTDGSGSTPGTDSRFPDALAERLAAAGRPCPVLNQGIGGNRLTIDSAWLGERATSRFRRDVLELPGIGTVVVQLGINDIGISEVAEASPYPVLAPYTEVSAEAIIDGYRDLIGQARAAGLRVVGATLTPMGLSTFSTARSEAKRGDINAWIRTSGEYDAVIDLDAALRSPSDPDRLHPAYDSGDHLHPNGTGYRVMAEVVDLTDLR